MKTVLAFAAPVEASRPVANGAHAEPSGAHARHDHVSALGPACELTTIVPLPSRLRTAWTLALCDAAAPSATDTPTTRSSMAIRRTPVMLT
jgi:hypothetical protein